MIGIFVTPSKIQKLPATLIKRTQLNKTYFELTFQFNACIEFQAGQYMSIMVEKNQFRPYSICSVETKGTMFSVCIDIKPGGIGSLFAKDKPLGTTVDILIPLGKFSISQKNLPTLVIATGSGISPFRSMIKSTLAQFLDTKVDLLWGMRHQNDFFWQSFWQNLKNKHSNFNYSYCVSREQICEESFYPGRVTNYLNTQYSILNTHQAYLCGSGAMIKEVKSILIDKGMTENHVYYEKYY